MPGFIKIRSYLTTDKFWAIAVFYKISKKSERSKIVTKCLHVLYALQVNFLQMF